MAPRAFWKGYLKLSLVSCPIAMAPATSDREKVRFHTLNARTGNRVRSQYVDAETAEPVDEDDEARSYPVAEDRFVIVEDDELEAVALESTRTIDIETFVSRDSIGWIWLDRPHHLLPDDKAGEEAFAVIRDAMRATGTVAISRVVLYRRERAVMIEPCGKGMVAWTLRYGDEVREAEAYFEGLEEAKPERAPRHDRQAHRRAHQALVAEDGPRPGPVEAHRDHRGQEGRKPASPRARRQRGRRRARGPRQRRLDHGRPSQERRLREGGAAQEALITPASPRLPFAPSGAAAALKSSQGSRSSRASRPGAFATVK
jgi:DNA end-binding protein Ku